MNPALRTNAFPRKIIYSKERENEISFTRPHGFVCFGNLFGHDDLRLINCTDHVFNSINKVVLGCSLNVFKNRLDNHWTSDKTSKLSYHYSRK